LGIDALELASELFAAFPIGGGDEKQRRKREKCLHGGGGRRMD